MTTTDSAELAHRVYARALDWLSATRSCFALPDLPAYDLDLDTFKALAELAVAARIVMREAVAGPKAADTARSLLDFGWHQLRGGDLLYAMQQEMPPTTHVLETYSTFKAAGYEHPALERFLAHLQTARSATGVELVPNRQLGLVAACRRLGLPPHRDPAELISRTWLGTLPEPWMFDAYNGYAMTHTVFHTTDFGENPAGLPEPLQDYLHRWLPAWVEVYAETKLWDLLGELLIVGLCLSEPQFHPHAWALLAAAQRADGMLPNGVTKPPDDPVRAWRNHHHPTVVVVIAGTMILSRVVSGALRPVGASA
ncbi:DUF6895 family protein [Actinokineospora iranica]|uniref:DUF6895 domain-containing protein n=1 Tax=Actinokineospora iranica TaxID=1271860 RepID=A0A1G6XBN8_9PSEU|nr:hypothetical protein [Actinokineospora iranica]SDD75600.1 hypothetical protein SAMN05216174_11721 [Actinokineospora iranica]